MSIVEKITIYFKNKTAYKNSDRAPEGICPNCWGKQEWDSHYYTFMKGNNAKPSTEIYNSLIKDVARKLSKITLDKNIYTCATCNMKYD